MDLTGVDLNLWTGALDDLDQAGSVKLRTARHLAEPRLWVADTLGEHLWSKQAEIAESVRDNRLTAVQSAHGIGKSWSAAKIACWWLNVHPPGEARVITTAPTGDQVAAILWAEINIAAAKAEARGNPFIGRVNETDWKYGKLIIGLGRKPSDYNPYAFQGIHARHVLVLLDEACHDDQTDVLTEHGWMRFDDLTGDEHLLTMDPDTFEARYSLPTKITKQPYSGPMHYYEAKGMNYAVTPDHRMLYAQRRHGYPLTWHTDRRERMVTWNNRYLKKTIDWAASDDPELSDDYLSFLGWFGSEGSINKSLHSVSITQLHTRPEHQEIFALCERLGFRAKVYGDQIRIHDSELARGLAQWGRTQLIRRVPDMVRMASARQIGIYLDAYTRGDGYVQYYQGKPSSEIIYTSSPDMADDLQELILKTGYPSVVHNRPLAGQQHVMPDGHTATSSVDGYVVTRPLRASNAKMYNGNESVRHYEGIVYCATVPPDHLLFTRRNGYTMWSGNCGINQQFWTAALSIATGMHGRILAIGNPDDPGSHFAKVCGSDRWNTIKISVFDTPNFTGEEIPEELRAVLVGHEYVEEMTAEFGVESPTYISKVLGEFPDDAEDGVVRLSAIRACTHEPSHAHYPDALLPVELGVDLGAGGDETCIRERRGVVVGREWRNRERDPMKVAGKVVEAIRETGATSVKVDSIGIGWGVAGRLIEVGKEGRHAAKIYPVNVSETSTKPDRFPRLRPQLWWEVGRQLSEDRGWDLSRLAEDDRERLVTQLTAPKYWTDSSGRTVVEPKDETRKRLGRSPDNADALLLAFYVPPLSPAPRVRWL